MKSIVLAIAAMTLTGCAHNSHWVAPAVIGAAAGVVIYEATRPQPEVQPRVYHYQPRPVQCHQVPIYNPYGYLIGYRTHCQ
jgi:hypothetical protein